MQREREREDASQCLAHHRYLKQSALIVYRLPVPELSSPGHSSYFLSRLVPYDPTSASSTVRQANESLPHRVVKGIWRHKAAPEPSTVLATRGAWRVTSRF